MPYSEIEIAILKKYRIMEPDGKPRIVDLRQPTNAGGAAPGPRPLLAPDVLVIALAARRNPPRARRQPHTPGDI